MPVRIVTSRCPQNHRCPALRSCPVEAISQDRYSAPVIDEEKCIDCGRCVMACPTGAIQQE